MGAEENDKMSFLTFLEIMTKLEYIKDVSKDREALNTIWSLLQVQGEEGMSQRNLLVLLLSIENIFLEWMTTYPVPNKIIRAFGYFVGPDFYVEDAHEVSKIHSFFYALYLNKNSFYNRGSNI